MTQDEAERMQEFVRDADALVEWARMMASLYGVMRERLADVYGRSDIPAPHTRDSLVKVIEDYRVSRQLISGISMITPEMKKEGK